MSLKKSTLNNYHVRLIPREEIEPIAYFILTSFSDELEIIIDLDDVTPLLFSENGAVIVNELLSVLTGGDCVLTKLAPRFSDWWFNHVYQLVNYNKVAVGMSVVGDFINLFFEDI